MIENSKGRWVVFTRHAHSIYNEWLENSSEKYFITNYLDIYKNPNTTDKLSSLFIDPLLSIKGIKQINEKEKNTKDIINWLEKNDKRRPKFFTSPLRRAIISSALLYSNHMILNEKFNILPSLSDITDIKLKPIIDNKQIYSEKQLKNTNHYILAQYENIFNKKQFKKTFKNEFTNNNLENLYNIKEEEKALNKNITYNNKLEKIYNRNETIINNNQKKSIFYLNKNNMFEKKNWLIYSNNEINKPQDLLNDDLLRNGKKVIEGLNTTACQNYDKTLIDSDKKDIKFCLGVLGKKFNITKDEKIHHIINLLLGKKFHKLTNQSNEQYTLQSETIVFNNINILDKSELSPIVIVGHSLYFKEFFKYIKNNSKINKIEKEIIKLLSNKKIENASSIGFYIEGTNLNNVKISNIKIFDSAEIKPAKKFSMFRKQK